MNDTIFPDPPRTAPEALIWDYQAKLDALAGRSDRILESARHEWSQRTFPHATPLSCLEHLQEEVQEAIDAYNAGDLEGLRKELSDCRLLLDDTLDRAGISRAQHREDLHRVHAQNERRKWAFRVDGSGRHVKSDDGSLVGALNAKNDPESSEHEIHRQKLSELGEHVRALEVLVEEHFQPPNVMACRGEKWDVFIRRSGSDFEFGTGEWVDAEDEEPDIFASCEGCSATISTEDYPGGWKSTLDECYLCPTCGEGWPLASEDELAALSRPHQITDENWESLQDIARVSGGELRVLQEDLSEHCLSECSRQIALHGGNGLPWTRIEDLGWRLEWGCESVTLSPNPENPSQIDILWETQGEKPLRAAIRHGINMSLARRLEDARRWHSSPPLAEPAPKAPPMALSGPDALLAVMREARKPSMCSWVVEQLQLLATEWRAEREGNLLGHFHRSRDGEVTFIPIADLPIAEIDL